MKLLSNSTKFKSIIASMGVLTLLAACDPSDNPTGPDKDDGKTTSSIKIGCGVKTGIAMNCLTRSGESLGNFNLDLTVTCSADQAATDIKINTDFTEERSVCGLNNQSFKRENLILPVMLAKTSPGGLFEGDSDLISIDPKAHLEWQCTENYSESPTAELSEFYHFLVFQRDKNSSIVNGVLENRNIYVDENAIGYDGGSRCTFQFSAN